MSTSHTGDPLLSSLLNVPQSEIERAMAARYAPILRFDRNEPFFPLAAGYTVFRHSGPSPSFRQGHEVDLSTIAFCASAIAELLPTLPTTP